MKNQTLPSHQEMTVKDWVITYLILFFASLVPFLSIIILLYWAFSENTNPCKKNWAKGSLLFFLILFGIMFIIFLIYGTTIMTMMNQMPTH